MLIYMYSISRGPFFLSATVSFNAFSIVLIDFDQEIGQVYYSKYIKWISSSSGQSVQLQHSRYLAVPVIYITFWGKLGHMAGIRSHHPVKSYKLSSLPECLNKFSTSAQEHIGWLLYDLSNYSIYLSIRNRGHDATAWHSVAQFQRFGKLWPQHGSRWQMK